MSVLALMYGSETRGTLVYRISKIYVSETIILRVFRDEILTNIQTEGVISWW